MPNGLAPHFTTKCVGTCEILHKSHPNVYTLKVSTNFVAHSTFQISKLKLFSHYEHKPNWKQDVQPKVDGIEHRLMVKIKGIFRRKQTHFKGKEYLVKYKGCHHLRHSSDILSIQFKHTRILRIFGFFKKYLKILDTKANFQAFVFL